MPMPPTSEKPVLSNCVKQKPIFQTYCAVTNTPEFKEDACKVEKTSLSLGDKQVLGAAISDFDGDSFPDILVNWKSKDGISAVIVWGGAAGIGARENTPVGDGETFLDEATAVDCNVDGIIDVLGTPKEGNATVCYLGAKKEEDFGKKIDVCPKSDELLVPYPAIYASFSDSLLSSVYLPMSSKGIFAGFHQLRPTSTGKWTLGINPIPNPFSTESDHKLLSVSESKPKDLIVGYPAVDDFNRDGIVDLLIPVIHRDQPGSLYFFVYSDSEWHALDAKLSMDKLEFHMPGPQHGHGFHVRSGDLNRDGYPDVIVTVKKSDSSNSVSDKVPGSTVILLENVPCVGKCSNYSRTFRLGMEPIFDAGPNGSVLDAAFIDVNEGGSLDFLFIVEKDGKISTEISIHSPEQDDTCFLLVQAFTSTCYKCASNDEGSGVTMPGACFAYVGTNPSGSARHGAGCLFAQMSHTPLSLPTILFGLGQTANFAKSLTLTIPSEQDTPGSAGSELSRTWTQELIPNSRIYVIPYPRDRPDQWVTRLFVTPSRLILLSFATLSCICGIIIIVIIALHLHEKRQDERERLMQTHKFHFSAM